MSKRPTYKEQADAATLCDLMMISINQSGDEGRSLTAALGALRQARKPFGPAMLAACVFEASAIGIAHELSERAFLLVCQQLWRKMVDAHRAAPPAPAPGLPR